MNLGVMRALVSRQLALYTHNPVRVIELIFWPVVELMVMGFLSVHISSRAPDELGGAVFYLIGAVIFWDVLFRSQQAVALSFLEDIWTRNLLNIFVAPIRTTEYLGAMFVVGIVRVAVTVGILALLARGLYAFDLLAFEWSLLPFFAMLMMFGWSLGVISTGLILRYGQAAEGLAWAVPFLIQPFSAVFYPVEVMPEPFQWISMLLPSTYVFEGMRTVAAGSVFPWDALAIAAGANLITACLAGWFFAAILRVAREKGLIAKIATQ